MAVRRRTRPARKPQARRVRARAPRASDAGALPRLGLRVLIAEENPVNRRMVARMLERWGCHVHAVSTGREAVAAVATMIFDAALMDVEMAGLGGLAATAEIRRVESSGGRHLPILALTAHASEDDRRHCLAAGMDEFLTRPLRAAELHTALGHWAQIAARPVTAPAAEPAVFRYEQLRSFSEGDQAFEAELMNDFLRHAAELTARVASTAPDVDAETRTRTAHTLKGMALNIGADALARAAAELEPLLHARDRERAAAALTRIRIELQRIERVFRDWPGRHAA